LFKRAFPIALILIVVVSIFFVQRTSAGGWGVIQVITKDGPVSFTVEYAITPKEKAQGLMNRKNLPQNQGMLFIYQKPKMITMWMKNTPISLDMFFINKNGVIRFIEEKTEPNSQRQIHSGGQVSAVLELVAGSAETYGIKVGDVVKLPN